VALIRVASESPWAARVWLSGASALAVWALAVWASEARTYWAAGEQAQSVAAARAAAPNSQSLAARRHLSKARRILPSSLFARLP